MLTQAGVLVYPSDQLHLSRDWVISELLLQAGLSHPPVYEVVE